MSGMDGVLKSSASGLPSGLHRKKVIATTLVTCLAAGEMPPYCKNCGEVSTPTWRKAFARVEKGNPDELETTEAWEALDKDKDGTVTSYRVFRKAVQREEKDKFDELQLCNRKLIAFEGSSLY